MRTTRIDIEGRPGRYASITRKTGSAYIDVTIVTPEFPNGLEHHVDASSEDDRWSMAQCLQAQLDECQGTNSMIHDYLAQIDRFAD